MIAPRPVRDLCEELVELGRSDDPLPCGDDLGQVGVGGRVVREIRSGRRRRGWVTQRCTIDGNIDEMG
jgi:hypothetical protein